MPPFHFSDDVEKKPLTWQYIRKVAGNFVHYYHPHMGLFRLSVGCALVNSGLTILVPLLVYRAFQIYLPAKNYPMIWADPNAAPKLAFIGCPHLSMSQLKDWTGRIIAALAERGRSTVAVPTVITTAPAVAEQFKKTEEYAALQKTGAVLSSICALMYMNNPLCGKMPVITCSNKLRTYTSARYFTETELLRIIAEGGIRS